MVNENKETLNKRPIGELNILNFINCVIRLINLNIIINCVIRLYACGLFDIKITLIYHYGIQHFYNLIISQMPED